MSSWIHRSVIHSVIKHSWKTAIFQRTWDTEVTKIQTGLLPQQAYRGKSFLLESHLHFGKLTYQQLDRVQFTEIIFLLNLVQGEFWKCYEMILCINLIKCKFLWHLKSQEIRFYFFNFLTEFDNFKIIIIGWLLGRWILTAVIAIGFFNCIWKHRYSVTHAGGIIKFYLKWNNKFGPFYNDFANTVNVIWINYNSIFCKVWA